jgi:hypothetical protein
MRKKAIASNSAEIQIRINPMPKRMINTAPMSSSNPAVENKPTPDFAESVPSERLIKNAASIENTQRIMNTTINPVRKGIMLSRVIFDVLGVRPESAVQSPFQSGKIVYRKSFSEVRTVIITAAIEITPPTIPIINP